MLRKANTQKDKNETVKVAFLTMFIRGLFIQQVVGEGTVHGIRWSN